MTESAWRRDLLGGDWVQRDLELAPDGIEPDLPLLATLVAHRPERAPSRRAVLYLHGYNDYFFHEELGERWTAGGWHFHALELRRSGRSLRPGQTPCATGSVEAWFEELDAAVDLLRGPLGYETVVLNGHSTGGLVAALYAADRAGDGRIQGLHLSSPFFDFVARGRQRLLLRGFVETVGRLQPETPLPLPADPRYAWTLHRVFGKGGLWDYDLRLKRPGNLPLQARWVAAIGRAQRRLARGVTVAVPVQVCCSSRSVLGAAFGEAWFEGDAVLDVDDMLAGAVRLGASSLRIDRIDGALHDPALSRPKAREAYLEAALGWAREHWPG